MTAWESAATMGKLHQIGKTIITVYANDHLPPHFHIIHPDFEALVEIRGFRLYAGQLKGKPAQRAIDWAAANIDRIQAEWNRINPRYPVGRK